MHKAHFLITVQLPLLESYHTRISSSLVAFETLSSIFVRSVPGALSFGREPLNNQDDPRNRTSGPAGANSLCKALLSATYMEFCLEEWGEDIVCITSYPFQLRSDHKPSFSCNYGQTLAQTIISELGWRKALFFPV
jgi:hypothetical protein